LTACSAPEGTGFILSGLPINWKKYWKGWERSKEDLNAEQEAIEAVARSLCWTKIKEAGDIAVWQKPVNQFEQRKDGTATCST
jgi:hypothetical protein